MGDDKPNKKISTEDPGKAIKKPPTRLASFRTAQDLSLQSEEVKKIVANITDPKQKPSSKIGFSIRKPTKGVKKSTASTSTTKTNANTNIQKKKSHNTDRKHGRNTIQMPGTLFTDGAVSKKPRSSEGTSSGARQSTKANKPTQNFEKVKMECTEEEEIEILNDLLKASCFIDDGDDDEEEGERAYGLPEQEPNSGPSEGILEGSAKRYPEGVSNTLVSKHFLEISDSPVLMKFSEDLPFELKEEELDMTAEEKKKHPLFKEDTEGVIGRYRVRQSGKVEIEIGGTWFEVRNGHNPPNETEVWELHDNDDGTISYEGFKDVQHTLHVDVCLQEYFDAPRAA